MGSPERVVSRPEDYGYSRFAPRVWHGMTFGAWMRMIKGHWRSVPPGRYGLVFSVTVLSIGNSILKGISNFAFGRKVNATKISPAPIFILGHWRSGTTWLHQLLDVDLKLISPTAQQCFMPETFLIGQVLLRPIMPFLIPKSRPMDNVQMARNSAEEDEHAIALGGAMSPHRYLAFPCDTLGDVITDPKEMAPNEAAFFRKTWINFLKRVQFCAPGKRLLLKSPAHTMRIAEILDIFPDAKFIHIVRDPYKVNLSRERSSPAMMATQSFQTEMPHPLANRQKFVNDFADFHRKFEKTRGLIPEGNLYSLTYENLKLAPKERIRDIYKELDIGVFADIEPHLDVILADRKGYKVNTYSLSPEFEEVVYTTAKDHFECYGYSRHTQVVE